MALLGSGITSEVGLRLLLSPLNTNVVIRTACRSVSIGIPVYSTFKAIEKKDQNDQQKWLVYWAAYGSFSIVEVFADKILSRFPFYYHLKFAFLVWLQLPTTEGAKQLYDYHLRPFLLQHQAKIDQLIGFAYNEMIHIISAHEKEIRMTKVVIVKMFNSVHQIIKGDTVRDHPQGQNTIESQTIIEESSAGTANSDNVSDLDN